jgi:hypothetical protein
VTARRRSLVDYLSGEAQRVFREVADLLRGQRSERAEAGHLGVASVRTVTVLRLRGDCRTVLVADAVANRLLDFHDGSDIARLFERHAPEELVVEQIRYAGFAAQIRAVAARAPLGNRLFGRGRHESFRLWICSDSVGRFHRDALGERGQRRIGLRRCQVGKQRGCGQGRNGQPREDPNGSSVAHRLILYWSVSKQRSAAPAAPTVNNGYRG